MPRSKTKKLTLHEKAREGFSLANLMLSYAHELAADSRDFGWNEGAKLAQRMEASAKEYREKFRS